MKIGLVLAALVTSVSAADPVAPLRPKVEPMNALGEELVNRMQESVADGLGKGGLEASPTSGVRRKLSRKLASCAAADCAAEAAKQLKVERVVATRVRVTGKNYELECEIFSAAGTSVAQASGSCDICTFAEAEREVANVAKELAERARQAEGSVPAVVAPIPTAPEPATEPAPLEKPERAAVPREAPKPAAASSQILAIDTTQSRKRPYLWWAVGTWTASAVALGVGGYLVSTHGDPSCESEDPTFDPRTQCEEIFNTGGVGAVLVGAGLVGLVGGTLLFLRKDSLPVFGASIGPPGKSTVATAWMKF